MRDSGILILRLGIGVMFVAHGLQMAFGMFGGTGVEGFAGFLQALHFIPALFWAYVAAYTVLLGGLCLIVGAFVRTAAFLLAVFITVAALSVHLQGGFFLTGGGIEYCWVIASACIALLLSGAGKYSVYDTY